MNYTRLSHAFKEVKDASPAEVGRKIGGKVKTNIDAGIFNNACALRLSYAIHKAGGTISSSDGAVSSGADGKWYLYRVNDMVKYIERHASRKITGSKLSDIQGNSGIIVFGNCNWGDATGHVDLFNGTEVEGKAYWSTCGKITLYIL